MILDDPCTLLVTATIRIDWTGLAFRPQYDPVSPGRPYLMFDGQLLEISGPLPGGASAWRFDESPDGRVNLVHEFNEPQIATLATHGIYRAGFDPGATFNGALVSIPIYATVQTGQHEDGQPIRMARIHDAGNIRIDHHLLDADLALQLADPGPETSILDLDDQWNLQRLQQLDGDILATSTTDDPQASAPGYQAPEPDAQDTAMVGESRPAALIAAVERQHEDTHAQRLAGQLFQAIHAQGITWPATRTAMATPAPGIDGNPATQPANPTPETIEAAATQPATASMPVTAVPEDGQPGHVAADPATQDTMPATSPAVSAPSARDAANQRLVDTAQLRALAEQFRAAGVDGQMVDRFAESIDQVERGISDEEFEQAISGELPAITPTATPVPAPEPEPMQTGPEAAGDASFGWAPSDADGKPYADQDMPDWDPGILTWPQPDTQDSNAASTSTPAPVQPQTAVQATATAVRDDDRHPHVPIIPGPRHPGASSPVPAGKPMPAPQADQAAGQFLDL